MRNKKARQVSLLKQLLAKRKVDREGYKKKVFSDPVIDINKDANERLRKAIVSKVQPSSYNKLIEDSIKDKNYTGYYASIKKGTNYSVTNELSATINAIQQLSNIARQEQEKVQYYDPNDAIVQRVNETADDIQNVLRPKLDQMLLFRSRVDKLTDEDKRKIASIVKEVESYSFDLDKIKNEVRKLGGMQKFTSDEVAKMRSTMRTRKENKDLEYKTQNVFKYGEEFTADDVKDIKEAFKDPTKAEIVDEISKIELKKLKSKLKNLKELLFNCKDLLYKTDGLEIKLSKKTDIKANEKVIFRDLIAKMFGLYTKVNDFLEDGINFKIDKYDNFERAIKMSDTIDKFVSDLMSIFEDLKNEFNRLTLLFNDNSGKREKKEFAKAEQKLEEARDKLKEENTEDAFLIFKEEEKLAKKAFEKLSSKLEKEYDQGYVVLKEELENLIMICKNSIRYINEIIHNLLKTKDEEINFPPAKKNDLKQVMKKEVDEIKKKGAKEGTDFVIINNKYFLIGQTDISFGLAGVRNRMIIDLKFLKEDFERKLQYLSDKKRKIITRAEVDFSLSAMFILRYICINENTSYYQTSKTKVLYLEAIGKTVDDKSKYAWEPRYSYETKKEKVLKVFEITSKHFVKTKNEEIKTLSVVDLLKFLNEQEYYYGMIMINSELIIRNLEEQAMLELKKIQLKLERDKRKEAKKLAALEAQKVADELEKRLQEEEERRILEEIKLKKEADLELVRLNSTLDEKVKYFNAYFESLKKQDFSKKTIKEIEEIAPEVLDNQPEVLDNQPEVEAQKEEIEGKKEEIELSEKSEVTEISDVSSKDPGEWVQISKKLRNYLGEEKVNELIEFTKNLYYDFVETNRVFALLENNFYKKDLTKEYVAVIDKYKELKDDEGNLIWITVILKSIKDYFKLNQKTILLQKSEECQEIIEDNKLDSNKILDIA